MSAIVALNNAPLPGHGVSPETLWRALRPLQSRWRNLGLKEAIHGKRATLSEEEWLSYIDECDRRVTIENEDPKKLCARIEEKMAPIREAVESEAYRKQMARRLQWKRDSAPGIAALMSGDRVICKNSQYVSKVGEGKFQHRDGATREYRVLSVSQGFVELEEIGTGSVTKRHESDLKIMPRVTRATGSVDSESAGLDGGPRLEAFKVKDDGRCFFRSASAEKYGGVLVDDDEASLTLRTEVHEWAKKWVEDKTPAERRELRMQVANEMKDDPQWDAGAAWTWPKYWKYMEDPRRFATYFTIVAFVTKTGRSVEVYEATQKVTPRFQLIRQELGTGTLKPLKVVLSGQHYNLLVDEGSVKRSASMAMPSVPPAKRAKRCTDSVIKKRPAKA